MKYNKYLKLKAKKMTWKEIENAGELFKRRYYMNSFAGQILSIKEIRIKNEIQ